MKYWAIREGKLGCLQGDTTLKAQGHEADNLLDAAIRSAVMSQYVYSKAHFDNAKDTKAMLAAAQDSTEMLINAVKYRVADRIEQLLLAKVEDMVGRGEAILRVGDKLYSVIGLVPTDSTPSAATSNKPPKPTPREDV